MKVVHILCGKANPERTLNGLNVAVDAYARAMHAIPGVQVEVWGIASNPHTNLPEPPYPIRFFQHHHDWPRTIERDLLERARSLAGERAVLHFYSGFMAEYPGLVAAARGVPYFVMPQGIYSEACLARRPWRKLVYTLVRERPLLERSSGLLLASEGELSPRFRRLIGRAPIDVVPNGADPTLLPYREDTAADPDGVTVWGYCGRISNPQKAVDRIVRTFLRFARGRADRHVLSLVGDGEDLPALRARYADEIAAGLIEVHGPLYGPIKAQALARMHYFVHLSNWEGLPMACLDAAQLGLPLLVTPETNIAEAVQEYGAGVVTSPDDAAVVEAMATLTARDRGRLRLGAMRLADERYSWRRSTQLLLERYEAALASGRLGR